MNENGAASGKQTPLTVGSGPPPRYFGIPEEPWEDGALYVLRVDGRSAWLEKTTIGEAEMNWRYHKDAERLAGKAAPGNRTSTADFEPHGNS